MQAEDRHRSEMKNVKVKMSTLEQLERFSNSDSYPSDAGDTMRANRHVNGRHSLTPLYQHRDLSDHFAATDDVQNVDTIVNDDATHVHDTNLPRKRAAAVATTQTDRATPKRQKLPD